MTAARDCRFAWYPDPETIAQSKLTEFLEFASVPDTETLAQRSAADPGWLWDTVIRYADIAFFRPYDTIMDTRDGIEWTRWCVGGTTNMALNCIDRHRGTPVYDRTCLIWEGERGDGRRYTYREFDVEVCKLAHVLRALGYGKGDVVALYLPALPETFVAYFAIVKIGGIVLPLFSGFGAHAIRERLELAAAKALVTVDGTWRRGKQIPMQPILSEGIDGVGTLQHVLVIKHLGIPCDWVEGRDLWWHQLMAHAVPEADTEPMQADDPAVIHFTSGTTGRPKGCVYTQIGLVVKMVLDHGILTDFRETDRHFCMADMGWMVGSKSAVIPTVHGGSMLIAEGVPDYPEPGRYWKLIEKHRVTWVELAPALIRAQMRHGEENVRQYNLGCLRIVCSGGEVWTARPWQWLFEVVGQKRIPILNSAGGTEVSGSILLCDLHHPLKIGSFSIAIPGMGADVVDPAGNPVAPGEMGELVLRHSSIGLTQGLWNERERYLDSYWRVIPGLWVHGDLASRDADGHWYLHGRSDDTLKVSGRRLGPAEVENILMHTGHVAEVAVVGTPDPRKGTAIVAVCVLQKGVEPAAALARAFTDAVAHALGKPFRPERVLFVEDLPKTRNMKIMRRAVRAAITGEAAGDTSVLHNPETIDALRAVATTPRAASARVSPQDVQDTLLQTSGPGGVASRPPLAGPSSLHCRS